MAHKKLIRTKDFVFEWISKILAKLQIFVDNAEFNDGLIEPSIYNELLLEHQIKETQGITEQLKPSVHSDVSVYHFDVECDSLLKSLEITTGREQR